MVDATGALRAVVVDDRIDLYAGDATTPLRTMPVEGRVVVDLALSSDGRGLAAGGGDGTMVCTASWDQTVRRWDRRVLDAEPARLKADREAAWQVGLDALVSR